MREARGSVGGGGEVGGPVGLCGLGCGGGIERGAEGGGGLEGETLRDRTQRGAGELEAAVGAYAGTYANVLERRNVRVRDRNCGRGASGGTFGRCGLRCVAVGIGIRRHLCSSG